MPSYAGENSMAPSCARKLTMIELKLKELVAKPHAYALDPSDLQFLAECRRGSLVYEDLTIVYDGSSITVC